MSGIGDEIREFVRRSYADEHMDPRELIALADRADTEMVELPKDADGREVPLDTKELYDANGKKVNITSFAFRCDAYGCWSDWKAFSPDARREDGMFYVDGLYLTPPDNLERIADELEGWSESNRINGSGEVFYRAGDLAERIRKLAKEGEHGAD
ncbi:hypothetical protein ACTQ1D_01460 [Parafannyhessea umbonata]|uniref:hypothetical protein n=1 Tax=Parafannyhessea umbonata TaxID=604330 RepID=UPI003F996DFA